MEPSQILLKAAKYMDNDGMTGACFAITMSSPRAMEVDGVTVREGVDLAKEYFSLFSEWPNQTEYWFGVCIGLTNTKEEQKQALVNKQYRVLALLLAAAIAESEGN